MQTAAQKQEQQHKRIGYAGTIILHVLLFLLMWWLALNPPDPPIEYGGMGLTMALGEANAGGPSETPVEQPSEPQPTPPVEETPAVVETQETEEAPAVATPPKEVKKPVEKPKEKPKPVETPRKVDDRSLFKKRTTTSADPSGSGDGDEAGNQGDPSGVLGGDPHGNGFGNGGNGSGTGTGDGNGPGSQSGGGPFSYVLSGRSVSRRPTIEDNSKETGKVVVSIVVDRSGKVTKALPNQRGTTTLSPVLLAKAKQAALETRFSPKPDAPEEQFGTITIVFKFKP